MVLHNAEFSSGRRPTSQEDAWATPRSPGAHRSATQAPICCNATLVSPLYELLIAEERAPRSGAVNPAT